MPKKTAKRLSASSEWSKYLESLGGVQMFRHIYNDDAKWVIGDMEMAFMAGRKSAFRSRKNATIPNQRRRPSRA